VNIPDGGLPPPAACDKTNPMNVANCPNLH
jgi:hypothetical protein